jgi:hypothetical protein
MDLDPTTLRPNRLGSYLSLALGLLFGLVAALLLSGGNRTGLIAAVLAAIGLVAGIAGLIPGRAYLRLDDQGFYVKSISKSWGAKWVEVDGFTPKRVRLGRNSNVPVVVVSYLTGIGDAHLPRNRLERETIGIDERYLVPAYANLDNERLAAMLERYRDRYG